MNARLSLDALLSHPDSGGVRPVAPGAGTWSGVVVESVEALLPVDGDGRLAVLVAGQTSSPWQHDAMVRRLADRGYAALATPDADQLGAGTRALATRVGLAVLQVDRPMQLARVCWQLLEGRDALTLEYVHRIAQSIQYRAEGLTDLLRHLAAGIGHGVALVDGAGVLFGAGGALPDEVYAQLGVAQWSSTAAVADVGAASVRVHSPARDDLRLVLFGTGLDARHLDALRVAAEVAMPAIAARLLADEVAEVNDATLSSGVLRDFTDRRGGADPEIERRMLERGWRTSGYHLGFRMTGRVRIDVLALLRSVKRSLEAVPAVAHVTMAGRGVTGWLSYSELPAPETVERHITALRSVHAETRREFNVATGVGSLTDGFRGLADTLGEAADAARIAAERSATGWFVRVDGLGLEQLLLVWTANDRFLPAARSLLEPLDGVPGDLRRTLRTYLDNESAIGATAEELGLHRNTVATRIQRVQELLGVDMTDPEVRLALHLACRTTVA